MNYSYLNPKDNVSIPPPMKNAGLYSGDVPFTQKQWSKDYSEKRIEPDAVAYSSKFFPLAQGHIPTSIRLGNNSIKNGTFTIKDYSYNTMCYQNTN